MLAVMVGAFLAGFGSAQALDTFDLFPNWQLPLPTPSPTPTRTLPAEPTSTPTPITPPTPTNEDEEAFALFWEAWGLIQDHYYGDLPTAEKLTHAAIRGMLESLDDRFVAFVEPDVAAMQAEDESGEFQGIGAWIDMDPETGELIIIDTFEGSPAEVAGLEAEDRVLAVDGVSIIDRSIYEAIQLIRGPEGSTVTLLVEREGVDEPFEIEITRARVEIPLTEAEVRDDGVAYVRLYDFQATVTSDRLRQALETALAEDPEGLVFDLRGNGGGRLDEAIDVADLFLADGLILIERWGDGRENTYDAQPGELAEEIEMVVLVDRASASASEIVAGALQDHGRAVLVGETTFGKGAVQLVFNLSDGSELWVPAARWFTPNDRMIQGTGLTPDIEIPYPEDGTDQASEGEALDPQLERAVDYLLESE